MHSTHAAQRCCCDSAAVMSILQLMINRLLGTQQLIIPVHKFDLRVVASDPEFVKKTLLKWPVHFTGRRQLHGRLVRALEEIVVKRKLH